MCDAAHNARTDGHAFCSPRHHSRRERRGSTYGGGEHIGLTAAGPSLGLAATVPANRDSSEALTLPTGPSEP
jgi:hypothetical protein